MTYPSSFVPPALLLVFCAGSSFAQDATTSRPPARATSASSTAAEYTIKLIDPNGGREFLYPHALNNLGEITGQRFDGAFIYKGGKITLIALGSGIAINDAGDVVGADAGKPFLYSGQSGLLTTLDIGQPNVIASQVTGINNLGQIIGNFTQDKVEHIQGFLYQNGTTTLLSGSKNPIVINSHGEIAGNTPSGGFLSTNGFDLAILPPAGLSLGVTGIDSSGRVAGYIRSDSASVFEPFLYSNGKLKTFPTLPPFTASVPGGMNDCGEFVGFNYYDTASAFIDDPFVYTHGAFKSLAYLLTTSPYNTFEPFGINNRGEIFGEVVINGSPSTMIMVPVVPEMCGLDASIVNTASSTTVGPGGKITYTIAAKNLKAPTTQFTVTNALGRESRLLSCEVSGSTGSSCSSSADGRTVSINLPQLRKGSTATITLAVHIAGTSGDDQLVIDTATLSSSSTADYLSTAYTNIRLTADMAIDASLLSNEDGLLHYLATVTDLGPNNSHAALLLDPLPANTSFVSASTDYGKCSFHPTIGPNGAVRCPLGNLPHLVPAKVDVVLKALPAGCPSVSNTFSLTSQSIDSNSVNDSSTVVTPLSGAECISGMANR